MALKIVVVLFLFFLIGLEREEHRAAGGSYSFGGVRTFPLIGLIGYSIALISGAQLLSLTVGFLVVAGFLLLSYWHKLSSAEAAGVTSEMSGLTTFLVGALVCYGHFWIATTLSVASLLLLDLKAALEKLAVRIAPHELLQIGRPAQQCTGRSLVEVGETYVARAIGQYRTKPLNLGEGVETGWRASLVDEGTVRLSSKGESDRITQRSAVQIRPPQP